MNYSQRKKELWLQTITHDANDVFSLDGFDPKHLEEKKWGWKYNLVSSYFFGLDLCYAIKGGYCSRHYHELKANRFLVISGSLEIKFFSDRSKTWTNVVLSSKEDSRIRDIYPGVLHQFAAITDCVFLEYENGKCDKDDIFRESEGGILSE